MTLREFKLPDIGEGIAEGEIVSWRVKPGQQVKEEEEFVEVMTDKATVMITVPWDGVIAEIKYDAGSVVPVESVIAVIDTGGGGGGASQKQKAAEPAKGRREAVPAGPARAGAAKAAPAASPGRVLAAPATRRRAREMGIDLREVEGRGPRGRVTVEDLTAHLSRTPSGTPTTKAPPAATAPAPAPRPAVSLPPGEREQRVPFIGLRRKIAQAMHTSKNTAAHFTYVDDIDVTELVKLRKQAKAAYADKGINITYMPFIMKAVVQAMREFPMMNSALDEAAQELVIKSYYNFGFAADTDNGLIVPVIKDVDQKSVSQLAQETQDLANRTREGRVSVDELTGGTFTITNAGNIGGLFATPIINFPEVAILGVHAIKKAPVVTADDQIAVGQVMYLSVSIDHRIVDGATGARWMNVVKDCLENPWRLLLGQL